MIAIGVGYEGVKQAAFHHHLAAAPAAAKAPGTRAKPTAPATAAAVIPVAQEPTRDEKPFRRAAVTTRAKHRAHVVRLAAPATAKPEHKEISTLPPSRIRGHDLKPVHVKPVHVKPAHVKKVKEHVNQGQGKGQGGTHGQGNGGGNGNGNGPTGPHGKSGH
jgi:hypothetical protein